MGDTKAIVRASAVRALAIFVLFPSLKEGIEKTVFFCLIHPFDIMTIFKLTHRTFADICYIQNTTEATIKLMQDESLPVRIKASWALANITDVLVVNM